MPIPPPLPGIVGAGGGAPLFLLHQIGDKNGSPYVTSQIPTTGGHVTSTSDGFGMVEPFVNDPDVNGLSYVPQSIHVVAHVFVPSLQIRYDAPQSGITPIRLVQFWDDGSHGGGESLLLGFEQRVPGIISHDGHHIHFPPVQLVGQSSVPLNHGETLDIGAWDVLVFNGDDAGAGATSEPSFSILYGNASPAVVGTNPEYRHQLWVTGFAIPI